MNADEEQLYHSNKVKHTLVLLLLPVAVLGSIPVLQLHELQYDVRVYLNRLLSPGSTCSAYSGSGPDTDNR